MRKLMGRGLLLGLLAGAAFAIYRFLAARAPDTGGVTFEASPVPGLPRPVPKPAPAQIPPAEAAPEPAPERPLVDGAGAAIPEAVITGSPPWVDPIDGACPSSHPVKAKLSSGIFHEPGGGNYERTRPERCYVDADAAAADGLRPPRRG